VRRIWSRLEVDLRRSLLDVKIPGTVDTRMWLGMTRISIGRAKHLTRGRLPQLGSRIRIGGGVLFVGMPHSLNTWGGSTLHVAEASLCLVVVRCLADFPGLYRLLYRKYLGMR
jgi:hypothetical protein